jgi:hypothetical protein
MFHPDNIKNKQAQTAISISLFNYWHKWGGPKGLAQRLKTDQKVSGAPFSKVHIFNNTV